MLNICILFCLVHIKKRSFLTSCVFWLVFLNASSHLCFRFFVNPNNNFRDAFMNVRQRKEIRQIITQTSRHRCCLPAPWPSGLAHYSFVPTLPSASLAEKQHASFISTCTCEHEDTIQSKIKYGIEALRIAKGAFKSYFASQAVRVRQVSEIKTYQNIIRLDFLEQETCNA